LAFPVTDAFSNRGAHIAEAVRVLGVSPQKKAVFIAVYRGKKVRKTVDEIAEASGLSRKQVLDAGKPLARAGLFNQVGTNPVVYEKIDAITHIRDRILAPVAQGRGTHATRVVKRSASTRQQRTRRGPSQPPSAQHDVFISHASEDKASFVSGLATKLNQAGITVWYDNFSLKWGDRLRENIDRGLANSRFGIVVLSHAFFSKKWPKEELEGLFQRELAGKARILPVWHNVTEAEVAQFSPMLAGRLAVSSTESLDQITTKLRDLLRSYSALYHFSLDGTEHPE
jgi:hypothetical protein